MYLLLSYILRYIGERSGATAIEYSLIAAGIALAIVTVTYLLGDELFALFTDVLTLFTG